MNVDEVKTEISKRTNIPVGMILGETPEEAISYSKMLIAYKYSENEKALRDRQKLVFSIITKDSYKNTIPELKAVTELERGFKR